MSKQENKQTVLESIYAFDASTAVMESIMNEGDVQFGVQDNDDDDDLITTADGDEVFNPAHLMDMNISDPAESGPRFNNEVEPMTEDDKKFYVDRFAEEMMNLHKSVVSASDIEGIGAYIQMTSDTRHDVVGFLQDEIAQAEQRLTAQNTSEALPSGVSADMTGDGVEYTSESEEGANIDVQMGTTGDVGDIDIGVGEGGLNEIEPTAHLTPNVDDGMSDSIDIGVDEDGAEPVSDESDPFGFEDDDSSVNPFDDLNLGDEESDANGVEASEEGNETASEEGGEQDDGAEPEAPIDNGDEDDAPDFGEPEDDDDDDDDAVEPFTESAGSTATFESVMAKINHLYKERCIKSKCDAIVEAANREIRTKAMMEAGYVPGDAINPTDNFTDVPPECENNEDDATLMECGDEMSAEFEGGNNCDDLGLCEGGSDVPEGTINPEARRSAIKAQCESIVAAYKKATARNTIKTQLESIVADYQNKVNKEKSVKAQCESIIADYSAKTNGSTNIKAKVESIIRKYRASK